MSHIVDQIPAFAFSYSCIKWTVCLRLSVVNVFSTNFPKKVERIDTLPTGYQTRSNCLHVRKTRLIVNLES